MAKIQVKVDTRKLKSNLGKVNHALNKATSIVLPPLITKSIQSGLSPVKGVGRFVKYSTSYVTAIKKGYVKDKPRPRPVNLTQSGTLLKSLFSRYSRDSAVIGFADEKADYHNKGTDTIPRRAMLPTSSGEEFNASITLRLRQVATAVINKILG